MKFNLAIEIVRIVAFALNAIGVVMAVGFGPPYLIMSAEKRAYLAGLEPWSPYIKKARQRDILCILGIALFFLGIVLHFVANAASEPLHFRVIFRTNY